MDNSKKQKIFWIITVSVMVVIFFVWIFSLKYSLASNSETNFFDQIRSYFPEQEDNIKEIFNETIEKVEEYKNQINTDNNGEDQGNLSQEQIDYMKNQMTRESENKNTEKNNNNTN